MFPAGLMTSEIITEILWVLVVLIIYRDNLTSWTQFKS